MMQRAVFCLLTTSRGRIHNVPPLEQNIFWRRAKRVLSWINER